jgi:ankyrin repeat protein
MSPKLTAQSNLESLRKEAKRWLKALRAGDPQALDRLARIYPARKAQTLRIVQHALALEYGFSSWAALKRELEDRALAARSHTERVTLFLEKSAHRYNVAPGSAQWNTYEPDKPARGELAARLLARHPEIAPDNIQAAAAAHDIDAVLDFLAEDSTLANQSGGPDGWTPLLRLAYTRLPIEALTLNAVAIATALLDHGANPNARWSDSQNDFTVLTGVIGGGEGGQTAHPQAEELARLLIARGADVDAIEHRYNSTPLGHANYQGRPEMIAIIAPFSRDIRGLCFAGAIDRLTELFAADRSLASKITRGEPPLFALPDDDERAVDVAELLLAHGADPTIKNTAGLTPAEAAKKRGLDEAAATISAAEP